MERPPAGPGAETIRAAFLQYQERFGAITRRARRRFESQDWSGLQQDSVERLELYRRVVDAALAQLSSSLAGRVTDRGLWPKLKEAYSRLVAGRGDRELAETFFNSVSRRLFSTVGVDAAIEFVDSDFEAAPAAEGPPVFESFVRNASTRDLVERLLRRLDLGAPLAHLEQDAQAVAEVVDEALGPWRATGLIEAADFVTTPFYRGKAAYVVGRLRGKEGIHPLILPLLHRPEGVVVDAVLLDEDAASIVFGFTRSYFHVEIESPSELVRFLKSLMPRKRLAELYISIGHNKHGKTELYRDLLHHLNATRERFELARGERGMVMAVFTLPGFDQVFKVIRDRFPEPKTVTREGVMQKYALVFRHDRAGRLIDAQEFEHLQFPRERFSEPLLAELLATASESVSVNGSSVALRHVYVERRLMPLNLYLREADYQAARLAVLDYGQAIRDLAATDIFPGDVLLKNFGLTRHGRIVFYDYDELTRLRDCRFRALPEPADADQELTAEPWFFVGQNDIFPEEFARFLGLPAALRKVFLEAHAELLDVGFWRGMQARLAAGEIVDIFPYGRSQRLAR